ncbi:hypothetical protein B005_2162 [Nocardiopsis alba ATCC BAA-2165]|uniref:Uncharacterized protein n=1 Tax=Nocardiopsis alba (strain ATCC BAA-2165 / BE74) TaxID=1205910 RepID=J7L947_NOCAA|nr:hypothetical protein B005_2162 [Nocardiopsis alba ATCC BAA-2165]
MLARPRTYLLPAHAGMGRSPRVVDISDTGNTRRMDPGTGPPHGV